jgi:chromosomal replication initiation ATPase DnaA
VPGDATQPDLDALWEEVRSRLRVSVPQSTFELWLEPLKALGADGNTLYLHAPEGIRAWTERRYGSLIRAALDNIGSALNEVSFAAPRAGSH